jgi:triosephosphate isomerase
MSPHRRPLIAGNWKMHKGPTEARAFAASLREALPARADRDVAVFPVFPSLPAVAEVLRDSGILWGAQDCHWQTQGAFTGEVPPSALAELGCRFVLVGHSERRQLFGETDDNCRRKVCAAGAGGLTPVLCVGETLEQRESGQAIATIEHQLAVGLDGNAGTGFVLAYEPVWAIGTGRTATPKQAGEVHALIRHWLGQSFSSAVADRTLVLYGGSVKPENIDDLMAVPDVDGALVGGASLDVRAFARLVGFRTRAG